MGHSRVCRACDIGDVWVLALGLPLQEQPEVLGKFALVDAALCPSRACSQHRSDIGELNHCSRAHCPAYQDDSDGEERAPCSHENCLRPWLECRDSRKQSQSFSTD